MRSNLVQNWQFQPWHFANFVSCQGDWSLVPCLWCVEEVETGILTKIVFGLCWAYVVFLFNMGNLKWTSFWRCFVTSWKWRLPIVFCDFTEGKMGWKSGEYMSCFPELPLKNSGHWRLLFDWDFWWKRKPTGAGAGELVLAYLCTQKQNSRFEWSVIQRSAWFQQDFKEARMAIHFPTLSLKSIYWLYVVGILQENLLEFAPIFYWAALSSLTSTQVGGTGPGLMANSTWAMWNLLSQALKMHVMRFLAWGLSGSIYFLHLPC